MENCAQHSEEMLEGIPQQSVFGQAIQLLATHMFILAIPPPTISGFQIRREFLPYWISSAEWYYPPTKHRENRKIMIGRSLK